MCIVTAEEIEASEMYWLNISKTNIFARHTRSGHQLIIYSMSIASKSRAAMILPLPVLPVTGEDALQFVDLSGYPNLFDDMSAVCLPEFTLDSMEGLDELGAPALEDAAPSVLTVHEVGDYEASYAPTMADFSRIDPCFRLPDDIWRQLPDYSDFGFAVFQLKLTLTDDQLVENTIHPMAFEFPTRVTEKLYFPTVHVHDGAYHATGDFYHRFYCQRENARVEFKYQWDIMHGQEPEFVEPGELFEWFYRTEGDFTDSIDMQRCEGLIDPDKQLSSMVLIGNFPNVDILLGDYIKERFVPIVVPDVETAKKVVQMSSEEVAPQLKNLMEHIRDADQAVVDVLGPYLGSLGGQILPQVRSTLKSGHGPWIRALLAHVIRDWGSSLVKEVESELTSLLPVRQEQTRLAAKEFCARHRLGEH
jgi:hypothetical protein